MGTPKLIWSERPQNITNHPGDYELTEKIVRGDRDSKEDWTDLLFWGDNKYVLGLLLTAEWQAILQVAGGIKLVYCDPPFGEGTNYHFQHTGVKRVAYRDVWEKYGNEYLSMIYERLVLIHQLLANDGNLFLHLNWHNHHYVKVLLDEIFGRDNFHNEIIYCYSGGGIPRKALPRKHDVILWYSKQHNQYTYNPEYRKFSPGTIGRGRTKVKGKYAILREEGTPLPDWWADVKRIASPTDHEKLYFDTQKSEELVNRIIRMGSNPGDLVADFFAGSGTMLACATKLGRKWIGCDQEYYAVHLTRKRLLDLYYDAEVSVTFNIFHSKGPDRQNHMPFDPKLVLKPSISWDIAQEQDEIHVRLLNYTYEDTPNDEECEYSIINNRLNFISYGKEGVQIESLMHDWDDWVDYWAVDDAYNEIIGFSNKCCSYRTRENPGLNLELVLPLSVCINPQIAIKVVDIFGFETIIPNRSNGPRIDANE